jgi:hypothetical protein
VADECWYYALLRSDLRMSTRMLRHGVDGNTHYQAMRGASYNQRNSLPPMNKAKIVRGGQAVCGDAL